MVHVSHVAVRLMPPDPCSKRSARLRRALRRRSTADPPCARRVPFVTPFDVRRWTVWSRRTYAKAIGQNPNVEQLIYFDVVLLLESGKGFVAMSEPDQQMSLEIFAVRHDGVMVSHAVRPDSIPFSPEIASQGHSVRSVLRAPGPGQVLRLRVFADTENTLLTQWPEHCEDIHRVPGVVVIVFSNDRGERARHVFMLPDARDDELWWTLAERTKDRERHASIIGTDLNAS